MFMRLPDAGLAHVVSDSTGTCFLHRSLRVLCLGDRLSSGTCLHGQDQHPYAGNLYLMLSDQFPRLDVHVHVDAVDEDQVVHGEFLNRLAHRWTRTEYDWTVVLGGTNDLLNYTSPRQIFDALKKIWHFALSRGQNVLALTIPESAHMTDRINCARNEVNRLIMSYCHPNFHPFELHCKIPYHSLSTAARDHYWDDGLHLSEDGYDWMGGFIADEMILLLLLRGSHGHHDEYRRAKSLSTSPTRPPRAAAPLVAANDINTRKPHELPSAHPSLVKTSGHHRAMHLGDSVIVSHSTSATTSPLVSPTIQEDVEAAPRFIRGAQSARSLSSHEPEIDESRGSVSPVYFLATSPKETPPHPTPSLTLCSSSDSGNGNSNDNGSTVQVIEERPGRRHTRSMSSSQNPNKVHNAGVPPPPRKSERLKRGAHRSWDMKVAGDEVRGKKVIGTTESGYVMVAKKDVI